MTSDLCPGSTIWTRSGDAPPTRCEICSEPITPHANGKSSDHVAPEPVWQYEFHVGVIGDGLGTAVRRLLEMNHIAYSVTATASTFEQFRAGIERSGDLVMENATRTPYVEPERVIPCRL